MYQDRSCDSNQYPSKKYIKSNTISESYFNEPELSLKERFIILRKEIPA